MEPDLENFLKRKNICENFDIYVQDIKEMCFYINPYRYIGALEFFLCKHLLNIRKEFIPPINFMIDNSLDSKGFYNVNEMGVNIYISDKNIKKQVDENLSVRSYRDEFFLSTLHEICHLKQYLKNLETKNISDEKFFDFHEEYFIENKETFKNEINKSYEVDSESFLIEMFLDREFDAEYFSYKNLQTFKNLYKNRGYFHSVAFYLLKEKLNEEEK